MLSHRSVRRAAFALGAFAASACLAQPESFHLMQIEQVIGGLGGDVTKQAVQLRMRTAFQNIVSEARLKVWDAAGLNPIVLTDFPNNVNGFNEGARVLIVSPGFPVPTGVTADFTMKAIIPQSYLLAGRITFEDHFGTIYWSLAYGGANYTGPNTGDITNDPDGDFGPPFPGPLPLVSNRGLLFQGPFFAASSTNAQDYALTTGAATLTDNAGGSGVLGPVCYPDCNASSTLSVSDFSCFQSRFATGHPGADCNGTGTLTVSDFSCFQSAFVTGCP